MPPSPTAAATSASAASAAISSDSSIGVARSAALISSSSNGAQRRQRSPEREARRSSSIVSPNVSMIPERTQPRISVCTFAPKRSAKAASDDGDASNEAAPPATAARGGERRARSMRALLASTARVARAARPSHSARPYASTAARTAPTPTRALYSSEPICSARCLQSAFSCSPTAPRKSAASRVDDGTEVKSGPPRSFGAAAASSAPPIKRWRSSRIVNCASLPSSLVATTTVRLRSASTACTARRVGDTCQSEVSSRQRISRDFGSICARTIAIAASAAWRTAASAPAPVAGAASDSSPGVSTRTSDDARRERRRTRISAASYAPRSASRAFSASTCARSSAADTGRYSPSRCSRKSAGSACPASYAISTRSGRRVAIDAPTCAIRSPTSASSSALAPSLWWPTSTAVGTSNGVRCRSASARNST